MKEPLLFLSAHLPAPNASEAGQVCAFHNLKILSEKFDVHLVAFRTEVSRGWSSEPVEKLCASTEFFEVTNVVRVRSAVSHLGLPTKGAARATGICAAFITALVKKHAFARVHLEGQQMAVYADIFRDVPQRTLYAQDIFCQTFARKAEKYSFPESLFYAMERRRLQRWERLVFGKMTDVYVPSEKDVELVRQLDANLAVKTKSIPLFFRNYGAREKVPDGRPTLVYWGAYSRSENVDAAEFLIDEILPHLRVAGCNAKVILAGANPPESFNRFDPANVVVTGFVADPGATLQSATIAVLPLRMGGGVKVKVLELLAAGVPVVTTVVGAEGIPCSSENGLIVTGMKAEDIASTTLKVLALSPDRSLALSKAAAAWARQYADTGNSAILN
jgi:glycosyltransferase involved in cell wall biosynthesis